MDPEIGTIQMSCDSDVASTLDRELQDQYRLNVQATDSSGYEV